MFPSINTVMSERLEELKNILSELFEAMSDEERNRDSELLNHGARVYQLHEISFRYSAVKVDFERIPDDVVSAEMTYNPSDDGFVRFKIEFESERVVKTGSKLPEYAEDIFRKRGFEIKYVKYL